MKKNIAMREIFILMYGKYNINIAKKTNINDILNYIDGEKMFV